MPEEKKQSAQAKYYSNRMVNDPDFYIKERERLRVHRNNKYANDNEYKEKCRKKALEYYYKKKQMI